MSISVRRICRDIKKEYHANLIAGAEGLDNSVHWVHIIEDCDAAAFLRGKELVFTTGIGNLQEENNLIRLVKTLKEKEASGLMINLGPYIQRIPKEIIQYCNEIKLPLYTVPWKIRLVDMTRDFCGLIIASEEKQESLVSLVKDYLFKTESREHLYEDLTRRGFAQHLNYCVIVIGMDVDESMELDKQEIEWMHEIIEWEINKFTERGVFFKDQGRYSIILAGMTSLRVRELVTEIEGKLRYHLLNIHIAVSSNKGNLKELPDEYELAQRTYRLAKNMKESVVFYDDEGIYKILMSVAGKKVIRDYENKILEPLMEYDAGNSSDYMDFIRLFIENDGSIQKVSQLMFVHRNTVHYKMNKVKEISGLDLTKLDDLVKIKLCLMILDVV